MEHEGRKIKYEKYDFPYLKKYLEDHPMTEEGLNKTRYRLAYEDGYRQAIKNAVEFLKFYRRDTDDGTGYIAGIIDDQTIEEFKDKMEEQL